MGEAKRIAELNAVRAESIEEAAAIINKEEIKRAPVVERLDPIPDDPNPSGKRMHVITNIVYGQPYFDIFCNHHLKSFLDPTNIPAVKDRIHYQIFTDGDTIKALNEHPNVLRLKDTCSAEVTEFGWEDPTANRFASRYGLLIEVFKASVQIALKKKAYLSAIVADLVCAKGFLPKILEKMDAGHGAVFMLPLRSTYEAMIAGLDKAEGALEPLALLKGAQQCLHPLWWACHWDNPLFTRLPFSLVWSNETGVLARSFSVTPIVFEPTIHMLSARQVIDVEIPSHCNNVYWCEDWTDAPIVGVEPLLCYYPPFSNHRADADIVGDWAQQTLHSSQFNYIEKNFYYPSKEVAQISAEMQKASDEVVAKVNEYGGCLA